MYKEKKIILFSFATLDLKKSIKRLKNQALISGYYDDIKIITPNDFDFETKKKAKDLIKKGKSEAMVIGFGNLFICQKL